ncbi:MAG: YcfL family protein [Verrucomicrobiota bacterium]
MRSISLIAAASAVLLLAACQTGGAKPPVNTTKYNYETTAKFALMDSRAQRSVTCTGLQERKTDDGRLEVAANLRNRENRRLEVQAQCLFKDVQGFALDETPWQTVILTENGQETIRFTAMNTRATDYEIRVRASR